MCQGKCCKWYTGCSRAYPGSGRALKPARRGSVSLHVEPGAPRGPSNAEGAGCPPASAQAGEGTRQPIETPIDLGHGERIGEAKTTIIPEG